MGANHIVQAESIRIRFHNVKSGAFIGWFIDALAIVGLSESIAM